MRNATARGLLGRGSVVRLVPILALLLGLPAAAGDRSALAGTALAPASGYAALPMLQPATTDTPSLRQGAVYPPPPSVPIGASICGPLLSNTSIPVCMVAGTNISAAKGGLGVYGLTIRAMQGQMFPNLQRDITLSQEEASGLFIVLGHSKFNGLLADTQVVMLNAIVHTLGQTLQTGNVYRLEVDQKTGNLDFRYILVGTATFTYLP
jgi:hypothetical protein